jgi:hypothetical protein
MTITTTFDSVPIQVRQITNMKIEASDVFEVTFDCVTTSLTLITNLTAKAGTVTKTRLIGGKMSVQTTGTKGTLVINGTSYTNCVIDSVVIREAPDSLLGVYYYTISFSRETVS